MSVPFRVAACQLREVRGDVEASLGRVVEYAGKAEARGAGLVCFPECFLTGWLVEAAAAREHAMSLEGGAFAAVCERLAPVRPGLVLGLIEEDGGRLFNTAVVLEGGRLVGRYRKSDLLPGERVFSPGQAWPVFRTGGLCFGINICSDTQKPENAAAVARQGAELLLCPANNMMSRENAERWKDEHHAARSARAVESGLWVVSADVTGEAEGRVSYGPTAVINPAGEVVAQVPLGEEGLVVAEIA